MRSVPIATALRRVFAKGYSAAEIRADRPEAGVPMGAGRTFVQPMRALDITSERSPRDPECRQLMARTLTIHVKPSARTSVLETLADGTLQARLKSPPVDGKANAELIALVAKLFGVAKSAVTIQSGAGARTKRVKIEDG